MIHLHPRSYFCNENTCWYSRCNDGFLSYVAWLPLAGKARERLFAAFISVVRRRVCADQLFPSHTRQGGTWPRFPSQRRARHGMLPKRSGRDNVQPGSLLSPWPGVFSSAQLGSSNFSRDNTWKQTSQAGFFFFANISPFLSRQNVPSVPWMPALLLLHLIQDVTGVLPGARFSVWVWAAPLWAWGLVSGCSGESSQEVCLSVSSSDDRGRCAQIRAAPRMGWSLNHLCIA